MGKPVYILGISGSYNRSSVMGIGHDPSAVLLKDGEIIAMTGEERFVRVKHAHGYFPYHSIKFCLKTAGITPDQISAVAWSSDPYLAAERWISANNSAVKRTAYWVANRLNASKNGIKKGLGLLHSNLKPWDEIENEKGPFRDRFRLDFDKVPFICVDHHLSHAASAYYASGFEEATVITWDGSGDGLTGTIYHGKDGEMEVLDEFSDFSIGEVYWAVHKYLKLSDEGSLMGLAGYGKPEGIFRKVTDASKLYMDLDTISRERDGAVLGYSRSLAELLGGPPRTADSDETLEDRHRNIAADLQQMVEEFGFEILRRALKKTKCRNVCFAGGVALNAIMNGKIARSDLVDNIFVQPNAGDGGGALGAAWVGYQKLGHKIVPKAMRHAYWGVGYTDDEIEETLKVTKVKYQKLTNEEMIEQVATMLNEEKIIGWFQGRAEWGPRALGARSIIADPRNKEMLHHVNSAVKYRDGWRPFAPSMLAEAAEEYLENPSFAPFMIMTFPVKEEKRKDIPSVVHVDGTTRPQMVERDVNPLYYDVIKRFGEKSGVPIVMNTSFNLKGEPNVNSPLDALRTFYSSGLDALAVGSFLITKDG